MGAVLGEPYFNPYASAGDQVSSTFEGRHVLIQESELIHPAHADGFVDKGDPVAFWDGVGVALNSARAATDLIQIETEGVWKLSVTNTGLNAFGSIVVGQVLYISPTGVIYDDWTLSFAVFGYALEPIADPGQGDPITEVIAVKVHWMWPWWYYITSSPW